MALFLSRAALRRAGAAVALALPMAALAPVGPASAAASLTINSATLTKGVAQIKLTAVCPPDKEPVPAMVVVSVQQGALDTGVSGSGVFAVTCKSNQTITTTVSIPGRTGSGLTSHDAAFVAGAAEINATFDGIPLLGETTPNYGTAEANRLS